MGLDDYYSQLLNERGQAATLLRQGEITYDAFGGAVEGPPTEVATIVVQGRYDAELVAANYGLVELDDLRLFLLNSPPIDPSTTRDRVRFQSEEFRIVRVDRRTISGPTIAYDLQVRNV